MQRILQLAEQTRRETDGFFNVWHEGKFNPSGVVKGWAISEAAEDPLTTVASITVIAPTVSEADRFALLPLRWA